MASLPPLTTAISALSPDILQSSHSPEPRREIKYREKHQPDSHDPVPVDRERHDVDAVLHVELAREDPDCQQNCFRRRDEQVEHVHPQHEPHDRTISIAVPTKVKRGELITSQHRRGYSESYAYHESYLAQPPLST